VTVRVSVVMPVYNTVAYLPEALESVAAQDLADDAYELICIDDGSTDGSGELLERWAAEHPGVTVLHQANSGWPGGPRNRGMDLATGDYVMFMDSDDYLGTETLRRLVTFADEHGSDVVIARLVPVDGRAGRAWAPGVHVDVDLRRALVTLMPTKLLRRSLLLEHGLRFPEGKVRLEDGIFMSQAYLLARRVSLLSDYDYYFLRQRQDLSNISHQHLEPVGYTSSIRTVGQIVRELCKDPEATDDIVLSLYRRKALKVFSPDRFLAYGPGLQLSWTESVGALADDLVPPALEQRLAAPLRTRSALARARDVEGQRAYAAASSDSGPPMSAALAARLQEQTGLQPLEGARLQVELHELATLPAGLVVRGRVRLRGGHAERLDPLLVLAHREPQWGRVELPVDAGEADDEGWQDWQVQVDPDHVTPVRRGLWDVLLRSPLGELQQQVHLPEQGLGPMPPLPVPARGGELRAVERPGPGRLTLRLSGVRPGGGGRRPAPGRWGW